MKYIKGFDGIRSISILFVISAHAGITDMLPETSFYKYRLAPLISGRAGVDIFFCLSGFLITRILLLEKNKNHTINFKNFYARRFLRLLPPLLLFYITIALLMAFGLIDRTFVGLSLSFFYLYNYTPNIYYTAELGHTWSLGVEEQYYLLWPIVARFFNQYKIIITCFVIIALCFFLPDLINNISFLYHDKIYLLREHFKIDRFFIPAAYPIIAGCLMSALIFYYGYVWEKILHSNFLLIITLLLFALPLYCPFELITISLQVHITGIVLFLTWLFYSPTSLFAKLLEFTPISYIGKISYGLYIYQGLFLRTGPGTGRLFIQQAPQNVIFTFIVAIISYEYIEKYFLRLKDKFR